MEIDEKALEAVRKAIRECDIREDHVLVAIRAWEAHHPASPPATVEQLPPCVIDGARVGPGVTLGYNQGFEEGRAAAAEVIGNVTKLLFVLPRYDGNGGAKLGESVIVPASNGRYVALEDVRDLLDSASRQEPQS